MDANEALDVVLSWQKDGSMGLSQDEAAIACLRAVVEDYERVKADLAQAIPIIAEHASLKAEVKRLKDIIEWFKKQRDGAIEDLEKAEAALAEARPLLEAAKKARYCMTELDEPYVEEGHQDLIDAAYRAAKGGRP